MAKYGKAILKNPETLEIIEEKDEILYDDTSTIPFPDCVWDGILWTWEFRDVE